VRPASCDWRGDERLVQRRDARDDERCGEAGANVFGRGGAETFAELLIAGQANRAISTICSATTSAATPTARPAAGVERLAEGGLMSTGSRREAI